jgi:hypothetical protein
MYIVINEIKKTDPRDFHKSLSLQTLKVSYDLEILMDKVVEIPWKYPYI